MTSWVASRALTTEFTVGRYTIRQRLEKLDGTDFWTVTSKLEDDAGEVIAECIEGGQADMRSAKKISERQARELTAFANEKP